MVMQLFTPPAPPLRPPPPSCPGKRCELGLSEGAYARTFKGSASPADLREAAQLVHLLLTTRWVMGRGGGGRGGQDKGQGAKA
jgi:hypothetical protein